MYMSKLCRFHSLGATLDSYEQLSATWLYFRPSTKQYIFYTLQHV